MFPSLYFDWWLLNIQHAVSQLNSGRPIFDWCWKSQESWVVMKHLVLCNGYNAPTLFWNRQKMSLTCNERDLLLIWSMVVVYRIITWQPTLRGNPYLPANCGWWVALWKLHPYFAFQILHFPYLRSDVTVWSHVATLVRYYRAFSNYQE